MTQLGSRHARRDLFLLGIRGRRLLQGSRSAQFDLRESRSGEDPFAPERRAGGATRRGSRQMRRSSSPSGDITPPSLCGGAVTRASVSARMGKGARPSVELIQLAHEAGPRAVRRGRDGVAVPVRAWRRARRSGIPLEAAFQALSDEAWAAMSRKMKSEIEPGRARREASGSTDNVSPS